jgi:hypothetical protein
MKNAKLVPSQQSCDIIVKCFGESRFPERSARLITDNVIGMLPRASYLVFRGYGRGAKFNFARESKRGAARARLEI